MKYLQRVIRKLKPSTIVNCKIDKKAKVENDSYVMDSSFGKYSYCGYNCLILNTDVGSFCSISYDVKIGLGNHPANWVSTSPAFYKGRDSISKKLASLEWSESKKRTRIGNDVWIGTDVIIMSGVSIGDGAVIGAGSVVTSDVGPYEIVAGSPARVIKKRFSDDLINELLESKWWLLEDNVLKKLSHLFDDPHAFLATLKGAKK